MLERMRRVIVAGTLLAGCARAPRQSAPTPLSDTGERYAPISAADVRSLLSALADDSMQGRMTATPGAARAARFIAGEMSRIGLEPGGDSAYFQRVPLALRRIARRPRMTGGETTYVSIPVLLGSFPEEDTVTPARRRTGVNVIGIIRGRAPSARDSAIVIGAHFDHLGIRAAVNGDSIYNGADDDASGVVAVLEIARAIGTGMRPRRTIVFVAFTGEEEGGLGSNWYLAHPVIPLDRTLTELEIEMIGRPDSLAGGPGKAWLTGYERPTMGDVLRAAGIPIVPDPRPEQHFFQRSDNYTFALRGIPAHTLSSFNLHPQYHTPQDEISLVNFDHMAQVIEAATRAVRALDDGPAPAWKPGGRPRPEASRGR